MDKVFLIAIIFFNIVEKSFSQFSDTINSEYKGIKFEHDLSWEQVRAKAKVENKYIFVDVYATWCGPCKIMDKEIYPNWRIGEEMNDKFISVKVQIDSTPQDNESIKRWYSDAHMIMQRYKIESLPTYLFFSSNGKLLHHDIGYMDLANFMRLSKLALDPQKSLYYSQYEAYKQGKKDYITMGGLAIFTKNLIGDKGLANTIAKEYKEKYLDKLNKEVICTRECLDFFGEFYTLITSKDNFFSLCYTKPQKVDKIKDYLGWAKFQVDQTITREEIENKVLKKGKATRKNLDWKKLESSIAKKYKDIDAKKLILDYQIQYYRFFAPDWTLWAKYKNELITTHPPSPPYGLDVYVDINMGGAWDAFLHCPDPTVLLKALNWIDIAIKLDGPGSDYLDTKANLLYKLGRKNQALAIEKEALTLTPNDKEKIDYYKKMELGEPTWPQQ